MSDTNVIEEISECMFPIKFKVFNQYQQKRPILTEK